MSSACTRCVEHDQLEAAIRRTGVDAARVLSELKAFDERMGRRCLGLSASQGDQMRIISRIVEQLHDIRSSVEFVRDRVVDIAQSVDDISGRESGQ